MHDEITVVLSPTHQALQVLAIRHGQEWMRASLPFPDRAHPRALTTLLEAIALWAQCPARVVSAVGLSETGSDWPIFDALGWGERRLHFTVEWVPPRAMRGRGLGRRGNFRALFALAHAAGAP